MLVQNPATGKILVRRWAKDELMKSMGWLKRMNARGNDILMQVDEAHALVRVGALTKEGLSAMERHGFEPALTVETHRGSFEAWVRLTTRPAPQNALQAASEGLARRFSGIADTTGYLAGFTVHGGQHPSTAYAPFALAHEGHSYQASAGPAYLSRVEQELGAQIARARTRGSGPNLSR